MKLTALIALLTFAFEPAAHAFDAATIDSLRHHIGYLASDALEGRRAGTGGAELAAQYIAEHFRSTGLLPLGDSGTYFQHFEFVSGIELGPLNALSASIAGAKNIYSLNSDYRPLAFSSSDTASGAVAFAGYGISAPLLNYDDFAEGNLKGKILVILRYTPDGDDPHSDFGKYLELRFKAMNAREHGAKAIIVVTAASDDSSDGLLKLRYDNALSNSGIPALTVTRRVANQWLLRSGVDIDSLQRRITSTKKPSTFIIPDLTLSLASDVMAIRDTTANVVGLLKIADTASAEYLVVGAHYDHLGHGGQESLAPNDSSIHNGADDNASGTAAVLELARRISFQRSAMRRNIIFIAFSGEEEGLLGSAFFTGHPPFPLFRDIAMVNLDMVGRMNDRALSIHGTGTSAIWEPMLRRHNADSALALIFVKDGYGGSDQSSFYAHGVPVLFFFTGLHEDYHKPSDDADKINYAGEDSIVEFAEGVSEELDTASARPDFLKSSAEHTSGDTRGLRVFVGTIPDFGNESVGMKISGVRENSPAAKGGLTGGDVIVKFGRFDVKNIYDYTYALQEYKPGDVVDVVYRRGEASHTATIKLERRN